MTNETVKRVAGMESQTSLFVQGLVSQVSLIFVSFAGCVVVLSAIQLGKGGILNCVSYFVAYLASVTDFAVGNLNYYEAGTQHVYDARQYRSIPALAESVSALSRALWISSVLSVVITVFIYRAVFSSRRTLKKKERFIRGGQLVSSKQLVKLMKLEAKKRNPVQHPIVIAKMPLLADMEKRHFMLSGDTGVGKSTQIMPIMDTVRKRNGKALVWDKSGELVQHFFREGHDIILNPMDDRCAGWSIFNEASEVYDFEAIAKSFFPTMEKEGSGTHWLQSAQSVFSWLFYRLAKQSTKQPSIDDILKTLIESTNVVQKDALGNDVIVRERALDKIIKGSLAEMSVNPDSPEHASSVIATLTPRIRALWYLRGLEDRERFSIKKWATDETDNRWVFIRVSEEHLDSVKSLITAWLDIAVRAVLSLPKDDFRQIFFFLDELQSLDTLSALEKGLHEGRKHGLRLVLGFTSIAKLFDLYGEKNFKAMASQCGTKLFFRVSEPDMGEWCSKTLLEREIISERSSVQTGTRSESMGTSEQREKLAVVSKDELALLKDLEFYIRLPGEYPTAKMKSTWVARPNVAKTNIPRVLPPETDYSSSVKKHTHDATASEEGDSSDDHRDVPQTHSKPLEPLL